MGPTARIVTNGDKGSLMKSYYSIGRAAFDRSLLALFVAFAIPTTVLYFTQDTVTIWTIVVGSLTIASLSFSALKGTADKDKDTNPQN